MIKDVRHDLSVLQKLVDGYLTVVKIVNRAVLWILAMLMAVMTAAITVQVFVRFGAAIPALRFSAPWTEELARYAMIWMIFLGLGVGFRYRMVIAFNFVVEKLNKQWGQALQLVAFLASMAFLALLIKLGIDTVGFGRIELSPVMRLSKAWVYWAMPVGAGLAVANIAAVIAEAWRTGADLRRPVTTLASEE